MERANGVHKGQQNALIIGASVTTAFGVIAVALRVISRHLVVRKLGADDWFMVFGMLFTCGYLFEVLYAIRFGVGLHGENLTMHQMESLMKIIYAFQLTYNTVIATVKVSIVCFYLRLGSTGSLRIASWATLIFLLVFYVTTQLASALQCLPVEGNWDMTGTVKKSCFNTLVYFYIIAVINILLDVWILIMPIGTLRRVKRPKREKAVLFVIFGIGAFSCISSMVRLYTIKIFAQSTDPFYDGAPINMWSFIEVNVAIVCASVPAMKPLFTSTLRDRTNASDSENAGHRYLNHKMLPLGDKDNAHPPNFRDKYHTVTYSAQATSKTEGGGTISEENLTTKPGGIEYERGFTVEEHYVGDAVKEPDKAYQ